RFVQTALASPVDKDAEAEAMAELRATFGRSVVTRAAIAAGTVLTDVHLSCKKPAGGLPPSALAALLGRTVAHDLPQDHRLREDDLVPAEQAAS
ncbi:hypothetical protein B7486_66490, partial [cyanobacterium TDX16]